MTSRIRGLSTITRDLAQSVSFARRTAVLVSGVDRVWLKPCSLRHLSERDQFNQNDPSVSL